MTFIIPLLCCCIPSVPPPGWWLTWQEDPLRKPYDPPWKYFAIQSIKCYHSWSRNASGSSAQREVWRNLHINCASVDVGAGGNEKIYGSTTHSFECNECSIVVSLRGNRFALLWLLNYVPVRPLITLLLLLHLLLARQFLGNILLTQFHCSPLTPIPRQTENRPCSIIYTSSRPSSSGWTSRRKRAETQSQNNENEWGEGEDEVEGGSEFIIQFKMYLLSVWTLDATTTVILTVDRLLVSATSVSSRTAAVGDCGE